MSDKGSIASSTAIMVFGYLLLGWIPIFGPLVVGIWSGAKAKTVGKAMLSWIITLAIYTVATIIISTALFAFLSGIPLIGAIFASGPIILWAAFVVNSLVLFIGAIIGAVVTK